MNIKLTVVSKRNKISSQLSLGGLTALGVLPSPWRSKGYEKVFLFRIIYWYKLTITSNYDKFVKVVQ